MTLRCPACRPFRPAVPGHGIAPLVLALLASAVAPAAAQSRLLPPAGQADGPMVVRAAARVLRTDPAADTALIPTTRRDMHRQPLVLKRLRAVRLDIEAVDLGPREFLRFLGGVLRQPAPLPENADPAARRVHKAQRLVGEIPFLWRAGKTDVEAIPRFTFSGRKLDVVQLLEIYRTHTGVGTALSRGAVVLQPSAEIEPYTYMKTYNLRWAVAEVRDFPGPKLGLPRDNGNTVIFDSGDEKATGTVSGFTGDDLEELIQLNVTPDAWGEGKASVRNIRGLFVVRHTAAGHREIRRLLTRVGVGH